MLFFRSCYYGLVADDFPFLHDPPGHEAADRWYFKVPIIGWMASYGKQLQVEQMLVNQAVERGPVPGSAWAEYEYDFCIRKKIEEIVIENAYPNGSTFHPLDPVELMFVLRYGDLNEMEIVLDLEEAFGIEISDALLTQLIDEKTTFIQFIRLVEGASLKKLT